MDSSVAKQFLISRVVEQAQSEHAPISEIERKMLYFTEVRPSLPDIYEVNAEFERTCNADEYEHKIRDFLKRARDRDVKESAAQGEQWRLTRSRTKTITFWSWCMPHFRNSAKLFCLHTGFAIT